MGLLNPIMKYVHELLHNVFVQSNSSSKEVKSYESELNASYVTMTAQHTASYKPSSENRSMFGVPIRCLEE